MDDRLSGIEAGWLEEFRRSLNGEHNTLTLRMPVRIRAEVERLLDLDARIRAIDRGDPNG